MSVQLIVYPQSFDGFTNSNNPSTQFLVDGINFITVNTSTNHTVTAANGLQEAIDFYNPNLPVNTWKRYFQGSSGVTVPTTFLNISVTSTKQQQGILQKLSNLTIGGVYNVTVDINTIINVGNVFNLSVFSGTILQSSQPFPPTLSTGISTFQFTANSTEDTLVIGGNSATGGVLTIASIGIKAAPTLPSGAIQLLEDGQVILDLYEDEDLPLSLSVDDFKNVAEQVQSYSKAFNLPATKRNNRVFDHIFEITREVESAGSLLFNPYKKTICVLKQDGYILFEGYLRMLDITDKEGEISYNVNLYSEVVALADILQDRTFRDLDFVELEHDYNKTNIKRSWNDSGNSITYTNPSTSGFRDAYTTLRYPFVDWNHQFIIADNTNATGPTNGNPQLASLQQAFRPFINIKYIIDRIFEATDFTYESSFFNEDDFKKLYMDFNWGGNDFSSSPSQGAYTTTTSPFIYSTTAYTNFILDDLNFSSDLNYDNINHRFVALNNNTQYNLDINLVSAFISGVSGMNFRLVHKDSSGAILNTFYTYFNQSSNFPEYILSQSVLLQQNDTLQVQWKSDVASNYIQYPASGNHIIATTGGILATTNSMLQTLRGELGQWDFLKGIITMFNLVSLPDENNPNNIKIEPYGDVFINKDDSVLLNWTEKIDVSEMKLTPLTDLNRKTIFKFVEDDDDFAFNNYMNLVGGHLYGSLKFDATNEFNILNGEDEIVAEPFAATVVKPLHNNFPSFITPSIYSYNPQDDTSEGFENSPRIMYNNGVKSTGASYYIPEQNGLSSENQEDFLQFSHLSLIPSTSAAFDFHFGECQLIQGVGDPTAQNLFNLYWLPYYSELYNPNTRIMTIRVNLTPADISTFRFNDRVYLKNKTFRVNKISYKPNDLATVEFILIP